MGSLTHRTIGLVVGAVFILGATAGQAAADPAEPTNYVSTITSLDPDDGSVTIEVSGGDAFLVLTAMNGQTVEVPGYSSEPYIRIDPDGSVWVNLAAPSHYINDERFGRADIPPEADADAAPRWERVSSDGTYSWHDHRTHWMNFDPPPGVGGGDRQVVFPWQIPIIVNGEDVEVSGLLEWLPDRTPWAPSLVGLVLAAFVLTATRRSIWIAIPSTLVLAGLAAVTLDLVEAAGTPPSARSIPTAVAFGAVSVVAAAVAVWRRADAAQSRWAILAASLTLLAWTAMSADVLMRPVLVSPVPDVIERVLVPTIGWFGLGGLIGWVGAFRSQFRDNPGTSSGFRA